MRRLMILRPEPGASASVAHARALGVAAQAIALFEVRPVAWSADEHAFDAIVATSANAFRHGGPGLAGLRGLPVHAVGEATAAAARHAGFTVAAIGRGGAEAIDLPGGRLVHLAGRDHHRIAGATAVVVYESIAIEPPPALDTGGAVVAVHSARAGERLAELVGSRGSTMVAAISPAAAAACGPGWQVLAVASAPSDAALLALARDLCQNPPR